MKQKMRRQTIHKTASPTDTVKACQRAKFTELAYLSRFVQCYRPAMRIADWHQQPVYIMAEGDSRTGIAFCDLVLPQVLTDHEQMQMQMPAVCPDSASGNIDELWLVFVAADDNLAPGFLQYIIKVHQLTKMFDKIFHFDFLKSSIQISNSL
jgi:hypothetical protein